MRQIILDTETTGLDPKLGHRIIEVAAVELVDRRPTGRTLQIHVDPEREVDPGASEVHGMTWDDLKGKPKFAAVAPEFLDFARGATWIIHNAPFDVGFLDREFDLAKLPPSSEVYGGLIDTLALAREAFPGKRNNLDALCERFGVSNAHRTLHGALLDAQLLAEVYLAMTRGQESLTIDMGAGRPAAAVTADANGPAAIRPALRVIAPTSEEAEAHRAYLEALQSETKGRCVWLAPASTST
ncbi:MAG TPA: DNA polymerase III subunit epsilon [Casimicrobiaceae bacterium]|nr:DNA polymerase III subunit epsilon [Casimicrobiaceae bacterium]